MPNTLYAEYEAEMRALMQRQRDRAEWHRMLGLGCIADRIESGAQAIMNLHKRGLPLTALRMMREMAQ